MVCYGNVSSMNVIWQHWTARFSKTDARNQGLVLYTRGDQKVRGKVLLYHIAIIDCNENSLIETTIHSKWTEIEIQKMWRQTYEHEAPLWRHFAGTGPSVPPGLFLRAKTRSCVWYDWYFNGK